ncbi:enoyl-CoA hydratase/isomerase family protein [Tepidiforma sp.]|uniref:enoyl-CoA hydratase/isomerase family protein n=1 Tax=Tepidiforma sp. TaxID=2682230 RepID=UPI002ADD4711|nr:enoyl-CoA hydratase/isomerase family protein [Tepidiforma sp.]
MAEPVHFSIDERGVALITLDRPTRLNAIDLRMRDLLWEYLGAAEAIPEVRVIVFRGEGRCFSAGADISEFGTAPSIMAARRARHERDIWWQLLTHRCVTIARMHGYCYGAGLELPLFCDLRIAADDARLALPEVSLAYIPSAGGTQMLPRIAPPGVAAGMILTGEPITAATALRWGIVDRVVPADALDAAIDEAVAAALADPAAARARRLRLLGTADTQAAPRPLP